MIMLCRGWPHTLCTFLDSGRDFEYTFDSLSERRGQLDGASVDDSRLP